MMHNGGINIIRRPLHVREGLAKIFGMLLFVLRLFSKLVKERRVIKRVTKYHAICNTAAMYLGSFKSRPKIRMKMHR